MPYTKWKTGMDVYNWWISDGKFPHTDENQLSMFEEYGDHYTDIFYE
ncbi:hypothetical protein LJC34_07640 [Oscillospiraceae bacterium OttesenSCG-928-G22]|nr:hypothetical protein [Oscillospiraceae bacterium OttesenSCG-928-G22]